MAGQESSTLTELRQALVSGDVETVARLLPTFRVAVAHADGQPRVALEGGRRLLPLFLSFDSWEAFASPDEVTALAPQDLAEILRRLEIDYVVFDPALETAVQLPAADVEVLLRGEVVTEDGGARLVGEQQLMPLPSLAAAVRSIVAGQIEHNYLDQMWAVERTSNTTRAPVLALGAGVTEEMVGALVTALRTADATLPSDLEIMPLDDAGTSRAVATWREACLGGDS